MAKPGTDEGLGQAITLFGLGDLRAPVERVSQAWSNDVRRVSTTSGTYAIKLFPPSMPCDLQERLRAGMRFEAAVLATGMIPMPQPVASTSGAGAWLVEVETVHGVRLARCHEWVDGTQVRLPLGRELLQAAGHYLGLLHAMNRADGDTSQLPVFDVARWERAVQAAAEDQLCWADDLAALTPLIRRLAADLGVLRRQRRPMQTSHRDYDPKNSVSDRHGRLVITDWDYSGPVLPDAELIIAATSFAETEEGVREFIGSYREAGGTAAISDRLALTAEAADVDWLLRNVEACIRGNPARGSEECQTARDLIVSYPTDVEELFSWPERLERMSP